VLFTLAIASCGGRSAGPTSPAPPVNVAGTWSGTSTSTLTAGPACLDRQPSTSPAMVQFSQSGATITGIFGNCSFHGTVSDSTISWTQDVQQTGFLCGLALPLVCISGTGGLEVFFVRARTSSITGTVSGTQISASGSLTDDIVNPPTGQSMGTVQFNLRLSLQRQ
jgi:hypothetical protein